MRLVSRWARHSVREEGRRCRNSRTVRGCSTNARRCPWRQRAKVSRRHIVRLKSGCDSLHVSRSPCQRRPPRDDRRDRLRVRMPDPGLGPAAFFQLNMRRHQLRTAFAVPLTSDCAGAMYGPGGLVCLWSRCSKDRAAADAQWTTGRYEPRRRRRKARNEARKAPSNARKHGRATRPPVCDTTPPAAVCVLASVGGHMTKTRIWPSLVDLSCS